MEKPKFSNRKEQLIWHIRNDVFPLSNKIVEGIGEKPFSNDILAKIPDIILIAKIMEVKENFGKELDKLAIEVNRQDVDLKTLDTSVILKISVMYSQSQTAQGLVEKAQKLTEFVFSDEKTCRDIFNKWKFLNKILS